MWQELMRYLDSRCAIRIAVGKRIGEFTGNVHHMHPDRHESHKAVGRPRREPESARSHRLVTFLTEAEFEKLAQMAARDERSLSSTAHRIIRDRLQESES
jgi:hypothetical protein